VSETFAISEARPTESKAGGPSFIFKEGLRFRHFPELDGLRGCAILLVLIGHTVTNRYWRDAGPLGMSGVLLFFVLSGFLITGLLCSEERRSGTISLREFYRRRVFRILPAFAVYILILSLLIYLRLVTDTNWKSVAVSVIFLENNFGGGVSVGHLWSLSLEEQFYLAWPLLFLLLGRERALAPTLGLIVGIWVYRTVAIAVAPYDYGLGVFEHRSDFRMDSILVGCALALLLDRASEPQGRFVSLLRWATHPIWVVPVLFCWTVYCERQPFLSLYLTIQTVLTWCLVLHVIAFPDSSIGWLLRTRPLRFLGLISYSLYLWNQLFISVSVPDWGFIRQMPLCLFASVGAAILSYFFVERPFLVLKRRYSVRLDGP
jgi:peptidoglycan/LPS O-acetylase OafA/YrhL